MTCLSLLQPLLEQHADMVPGLSQLREILASCWVHVGTVGRPWHPSEIVEKETKGREGGEGRWGGGWERHTLLGGSRQQLNP